MKPYTGNAPAGTGFGAHVSTAFHETDRGTPRRRSTRRLNDDRVREALHRRQYALLEPKGTGFGLMFKGIKLPVTPK